MPNAIALRLDFTAADLRRLARLSKDVAQARRLLALAAIYDGGSRSEAARLGDVTLQIIRDWVVRFDAGGADGLIHRRAAGPKPLLTNAHRQALRSRRWMAWYAGSCAISANGCGRSSSSRSRCRH